MLQPLDMAQPLEFCIDTEEFDLWSEQVTHCELRGNCLGQPGIVVYCAGNAEKEPVHDPCTPQVLLGLLQCLQDDQEVELCIVSDEAQMWTGPILSADVEVLISGQLAIVAKCDIDEVNEEGVGPVFGNPEWDKLKITHCGPKIH